MESARPFRAKRFGTRRFATVSAVVVWVLFVLARPAATQCYSSTSAADESIWAQYTNLGARETELNAGDPPPPSEECEAMGWVWDYDRGLCPPPPNCPVVLATGTNSKYTLTSAEEGVLFDIDGDGVVERVAWTELGSDVAFLAIDRDGDGRITSGRELFGNHTLQGVSNGFKALEQLAMAANSGRVGSSVNDSDPIFQALLLWTDRDHDGISDPSELRPLTEVFAEIGLGYEDHQRKDGRGNHYAYRGWALFRTQQGPNRAQSPQENAQRRRTIYDVVLATIR